MQRMKQRESFEFGGTLMINTDYPIESLKILLNEDCLSDRFHSLISVREDLIIGLKSFGCVTKSDVSRMSEDELAGIMLHDELLPKNICINIKLNTIPIGIYL